jgi:DNA topoisomerase-1
MELLREEKKGRRGAEVVKELGAHPEDKEPVKIMDGKYGPYVNWGKVNATIPKDIKVDDVTIEKAVELLKERQAAAPAPKRGARGRRK